MSDTKNRTASSKRRGARVIKVAPVTLAIRAALAVSATTFAFSASAAGQIADPPIATSPRDIRRFPSRGDPARCGPHDDPWGAAIPAACWRCQPPRRQSAGITTAGDFAAPEAESFGAVQDLLAVDPLTPGPGGVSGSDDFVAITFPGGFANPINKYASSTTGIADAIFASGAGISGGTNGSSEV